MSTSTLDLPIPPDELRERVTGTKDLTWFISSGQRTVAEWLEALASANVRFDSCRTIMDFGCGCGRSLRHLLPMLSPKQKLVGLDTDHAAISWVRDNLPQVRCVALGAMPPAAVPDSSVDLILCHSVFTHLPEDVQFSWLSDLARMLRPGCLLITSFHGLKAEQGLLTSLANTGNEEPAKSFVTAMETVGFFHIAGRRDAEAQFPLYYGSAFHRINYIVSRWLEYFELVKWLPGHALDLQDVVVLRRKPVLPS